MRLTLWLLCLPLCAVGCTQRHGMASSLDGGAPLDAMLSDGSASQDGGEVVDGAASPTGPRVSCGPNTCVVDEVCCDPRCGVCAFEGECPTMHDCPGP